MSGRTSPSRVSRPGKKTAAHQRTLRAESLEPRMMLSADGPFSAAPLWIVPPDPVGTTVHQAPTVATPIHVSINSASGGKTAAISVLGADAGGAASLKYTWSAIAVTPGGSVKFTTNGTNAAQTDTATFTAAGTYDLMVQIVDANGLSVGSNATVTVSPILTSLVLSDKTSHAVASAAAPLTVAGTSESLVAQGLDQFGNPLAVQPTLSWSTTTVPSGAPSPSIAASGTGATFTFSKAGNYSVAVRASAAGVTLTGSAALVVAPQMLSFTMTPSGSVVIHAASQQFSVGSFLDQFHNPLTTSPKLTWAAVSIPAAARMPTFTTSGSTTTVAFSLAGTYVVGVTATDASGHAVTQFVTVTVDQQLTSVVKPSTTSLTVSGTSQLLSTPAYLDQFGNPMAAPALTWSATTLPSGAQALTFSAGSTGTTVTFSKAGTYVVTVQPALTSGLSLSTTLIVNPTPTSISVSPSAIVVQPGATQQFTAQEFDQFHALLATQPKFTWTASAGTITAAGLFTAPSKAGSVTVTASGGALGAGVNVAVGANSLGLKDPALGSLVGGLDAAGSINRQDMIQILTSVGAGGSVSATDLGDLKTILNDAAALNMPSYVEVLASDVVNGNPANAHYQGQALGNLAAGSSTTQLTELIDKWFLGTDHPALDTSALSYHSVAGSLFPQTPSTADEHQGELGDCYFISSLGAIANSNPAAIQNMIINNGDGTYTVRFYTGTYGGSYNSDGSYSGGFTNNAGTADYVTVDGLLPVTSNGMLCYADYCASDTNTANPLWIPLLEKAYAQWNETGKEGRNGTNSYDAIAGGWMDTVDAQVLGHNANDYSLTSSTQQAMINALTANQAVTIGTDTSSNNGDTLSYGLYGCHAYAVTGYNKSAGTFTLYNPWGFDQPTGALTWSQLEANCDGFTATNTSGSVPISATPSKSATPTTSATVALSVAISDWAAAQSAVAAPAPFGPAAATAAASQSAAGAESTAGQPAAARSDSPSVEASATRAWFDALGTASEGITPATAPHTEDGFHQLAAASIDALLADEDA
jgi:hypothetical protein